MPTLFPPGPFARHTVKRATDVDESAQGGLPSVGDANACTMRRSSVAGSKRNTVPRFAAPPSAVVP